MPDAPAASRAKNKSTQVSHHRFAGEPAFPARWFYDFLRALPGEPGFFATIIGGIASADLTPASGCQNHTTSPSAQAIARQSMRQRPPHPASPTFVTVAIRPSSRARDARRSASDLPDVASERAATLWHDEQITSRGSKAVKSILSGACLSASLARSADALIELP